MAVVRIEERYQVTIPVDIRRELNLEVGDLLEIEAKDGVITLKPITAAGSERERAWKRLESVLDRVHLKMKDISISEEEVEKDVLEAIRAVRGLKGEGGS